jgi:sulfatase maturation enzyme AslB (radical SAM superfamily)
MKVLDTVIYIDLVRYCNTNCPHCFLSENRRNEKLSQDIMDSRALKITTDLVNKMQKEKTYVKLIMILTAEQP